MSPEINSELWLFQEKRGFRKRLDADAEVTDALLNEDFSDDVGRVWGLVIRALNIRKDQQSQIDRKEE